MSFISELKRRNVLRVAAAYVAASWLLIEVAETLFPLFGFGDEPARLVVIILAIGLIPSLVFAWLYEWTPEGIKRESEVDRSRSITPQTGRKLDRIIMVVLALALTYFAVDKFVLNPARDGSGGERISAAAHSASIAVLPFVNMSSDPEQDYFSDGISEEILNQLAQVTGLRVAGRTSSFAFKGKNDDLRIIGDMLGVAHVLEGSVRKAGDTLRITAQLIKVEDGYHLWSKTWDRELVDIFAVQDEIAGNVLEVIAPRLLGEVGETFGARETDPEVFSLYLKARTLTRTRHQDSLEEAMALLETAVERDGNYAPALAQLGIVTLLLKSGVYGQTPDEEAYARAHPLLLRSLELDPNLVDGWAGLGLLYTFSDINEVHEEELEVLERAQELNPSDMQTMHWLANSYGRFGQGDRAIETRERALDIDPLYPANTTSLVGDYNARGRQEDSLALLRRVEPIMKDNTMFQLALGTTYRSMGAYAEAIRYLEAAIETSPDHYVHRDNLAWAYNFTHQFEKALEVHNGHFAGIALWHLGRYEDATTLLSREAEAQVVMQPYFQVLNATGQSAELVEFFERVEGDLAAFWERFWFDLDIMGYAPLNEMALAYRRLGNTEAANQALDYVKEGQEMLESLKVDSMEFRMNRAVYFALRGETDEAIEHLGSAIELGYVGPTRLARLWPALEVLEGDPRYEALQQQMIDHLNSERAKLGLEPVSD